MDPGIEQFFRPFYGHADPPGGVFPIGYDQIHLKTVYQTRQ